VNQNDTRAALEAAARSTYNAYWDVKDAALKQQLLALFGNISDVSTKLNQEDLQSRDDDFKNAASAMSHKVLPGSDTAAPLKALWEKYRVASHRHRALSLFAHCDLHFDAGHPYARSAYKGVARLWQPCLETLECQL
jgi:hypothetical protein